MNTKLHEFTSSIKFSFIVKITCLDPVEVTAVHLKDSHQMNVFVNQNYSPYHLHTNDVVKIVLGLRPVMMINEMDIGVS